jgi:nicotinate-nucleotide pyrophosphorylase
MGFAPSDDGGTKSHVLVVAEVSDAAAATAAIEAGAGAVVSNDPAQAKAISEADAKTPGGCRIDAATPEQAEALAEAGADFLIFDDALTAAATLRERRLGRVLVLESDAEEERLRSLASLDLDALLLSDVAEPLTVRDQLALRRIVELTRKPLMALLSGEVSSSTLEDWRNSGVPAVLVPASPAGLLEKVIAAAAEVGPPPEPPSEERRDPLLPPMPAAADDDDDHDHE